MSPTKSQSGGEKGRLDPIAGTWAIWKPKHSFDPVGLENTWGRSNPSALASKMEGELPPQLCRKWIGRVGPSPVGIEKGLGVASHIAFENGGRARPSLVEISATLQTWLDHQM